MFTGIVREVGLVASVDGGPGGIRLAVAPDRDVTEDVVAVRKLLDVQRLPVEHHHLPGVALQAAVGRLRGFAERFVAIAVPRTERLGEALLLAADNKITDPVILGQL